MKRNPTNARTVLFLAVLELTMPKPEKTPPAKCERFCVCTVLQDCNLHAVPPAR